MAYDEDFAARVRTVLAAYRGTTERSMFGGLCFLINGNMAAGVLGPDVILRVGPEAYEAAVEQPNVRPFDFTGRPSRGTVYVRGTAVQTLRDLRTWLIPVAKRVAAMAPKPGATTRAPKRTP